MKLDFGKHLLVLSVILVVSILGLFSPFISPIVKADGVVTYQVPPTPVDGEVIPFLYPPYPGLVKMLSAFDHTSPDYEADIDKSKFTAWDGSEGSYSYQGHNGYDYTTRYDLIGQEDAKWRYRQVFAAADSNRIGYTGWYNSNNHNDAYGLYIRLDHVVNSARYQTLYGHLSVASITTCLQEATGCDGIISRGQIIGIAGTTGNSTGEHLHFTVLRCDIEPCTALKAWRNVDPYGWKGSDPDPYVIGTTPNLWVSYPNVIPGEDVPPDAAPSGPPLPEILPEHPIEGASIIDDQDPANFEHNPAGCAKSWSFADAEGGQLTYMTKSTSQSVTCSVTWSFSKLGRPSGTYNVYAYIPDARYVNSMEGTENAVYKIVANAPDGTCQEFEATVDQKYGDAVGGDEPGVPTSSDRNRRWAYIGNYTFGSQACDQGITLSNGVDDAYQTVIIADAIEFAPYTFAVATPTPGPGTPSVTPLPPTPTFTPEPTEIPATIIYANLNQGTLGKVDAELASDPPRTYRTNGTMVINGVPEYYYARRFQPDRLPQPDRISFSPNANAEPFQLGTTAERSFSINLWFRTNGAHGGKRVLANALNLQNGKFRGWNLTFNATTKELQFSIYDTFQREVATALTLEGVDFNPASALEDHPWIRVTAIKDGERGQVHLCAAPYAGSAVIHEERFIGGLSYWPNTYVDLGADYTWENAAASWYGDLDEFSYKNWAAYDSTCDAVPPTTTPTPTSTPTLGRPAPQGTYVYLKLDSANVVDEYGHAVKAVWNVTPVPGYEGNGNALHFSQLGNPTSKIILYSSPDFYQANAANLSLTIDFWFRRNVSDIEAAEEQSMMSVLGVGSSGTRGWEMSLKPDLGDAATLGFTVYSDLSRKTRVNLPLTNFIGQWVHVRAIKDGPNNRLALCARVETAPWQIVEKEHTQGIVYYDTMTLDLGKNDESLYARFQGDLDEFFYTNRADYAGECQLTPTPTPTFTPTDTPTWKFTPTPTNTPLPPTPTHTPTPSVTPTPMVTFPPQRIVYLSLDEASGTPERVEVVGTPRPVELAVNVTIVPGVSGNARYFSQAPYVSYLDLGVDNSFYLADGGSRSLTIDFWFQQGGGTSAQTMAHILGGELKGWEVKYHPFEHAVEFAIYEGDERPIAFVMQALPMPPVTPTPIRSGPSIAETTHATDAAEWVHVKAIKDGKYHLLRLCVAVNSGAFHETTTPFVHHGITYTLPLPDVWNSGTHLELGRSLQNTAASSWQGALDEFRYLNYAEYDLGCVPFGESVSTPTPTPTPIPTRSPTEIVYVSMNERANKPLMMTKLGTAQPVSLWSNVNIEPGPTGNARYFSQSSGYSHIGLGRDEAYYLADASTRSLTVDFWFRYRGQLTTPQTLVELLHQENTLLKGWDIKLYPQSREVKFSVYNGSQSTAVAQAVALNNWETWPTATSASKISANAAPTEEPVTPSAPNWIHVKAIKDGDRGALVLCAQTSNAVWRMTSINFTQGINYFRPTPGGFGGAGLDLGVDYRDPNYKTDTAYNWHGDLDEFHLYNYAKYDGACSLYTPTPTPTSKGTNTPSPTPCKANKCPTATRTSTPTPTFTPTFTPTPTATPLPTATPTPTPLPEPVYYLGDWTDWCEATGAGWWSMDWVCTRVDYSPREVHGLVSDIIPLSYTGQAEMRHTGSVNGAYLRDEGGTTGPWCGDPGNGACEDTGYFRNGVWRPAGITIVSIGGVTQWGSSTGLFKARIRPIFYGVPPAPLPTSMPSVTPTGLGSATPGSATPTPVISRMTPVAYTADYGTWQYYAEPFDWSTSYTYCYFYPYGCRLMVDFGQVYSATGLYFEYYAWSNAGSLNPQYISVEYSADGSVWYTVSTNNNFSVSAYSCFSNNDSLCAVSGLPNDFSGMTRYLRVYYAYDNGGQGAVNLRHFLLKTASPVMPTMLITSTP